MTTTKSLLLAYTDTGVNGGFFSPTFQPFSGGMVSAGFGQNEAAVAVNAVAAFTLANLSGRVVTAVAGTNTFTTRVAGADGTGVVSFPASTTGWFTDSTHSDSVSAGQSYDIKRVNAGFGPSISIVLASAQRTGPFVAWTQADGSSRSFSTSTQWSYPFGDIYENATESTAQAITQAAGTWQALGFITGAAVTATVTFKSRIGGADGNQVVSAVNPAIRVFTQDSTHSDSIVAGNVLGIQNVATASSGSFISIYSEFKGTISAHDLGCMSNNGTGSGQSLVASTSYFWSLSGALTANTTELNAKANLPYALTLSYLRTKVGTNTTSTCTVKSRKNGADGNSTISVGSGVTGELSDSTHSDSYAALDDMDITGVTGSVTSFAVVSVRALLDDGSVSAAVAYTLTAAQGTLALTGKAALLPVGRRVTSAQGTYTLTGETAILTSARTMPAVKGTYVLTGEAIAFEHGPKVTADQGSYSLSGQAVGFVKHLSLTAVRGLYTLLGEDVSHISDLSISAGVGSYHITGQATSHGHARSLRAHVGKYHVRKQKTVLRGPSSSATIWPVDFGVYDLTGQDAIFGQEQFRVTFSGFVNTTYLDWDSLGGSDYESRLHTNYVIPSNAMAWAQVPYLYVFVADTGTDSGLFLNVVRNWAEAGNTPQIGDPIQVYRHRDGYLMSVTKNRINGRGRAMQLQYKSETGKAFNIRGWAMWIQANAKV